MPTNAEDAESIFQSALKLEPKHALCRYNLALLARNRRDYEHAQGLLEQLLEEKYENAYLLASICARDGSI